MIVSLNYRDRRNGVGLALAVNSYEELDERGGIVLAEIDMPETEWNRVKADARLAVSQKTKRESIKDFRNLLKISESEVLAL